MSFLAPMAGLIAAALALPALVALYFLKLRRREMTVPSTLLWKRAVQDLQVNAPFQKMRRNLLLLLQLLILGGLLMALARPTLQTPADPGKRVVIVLDHSASMNATDAAPTRLDAARQSALQLLDALGQDAGGGAMIVSFAEQARVVQPFTRDLGLLRSALRDIEPTDQLSRLETAMRLLEPFAMESTAEEGQSLTVYVFSDGRVQSPPDLTLRGADLRFVRIGGDKPIDNVAIVSLSARRDFTRPQNVQVFAKLANYAPAVREVNVTLALDGSAQRVTPVTIPATPADADEPGVKAVQFELVLPGSALIEVSHDHRDMLAADDRAALVLAPSRRLRVLLVSEGNPFLERVIDAAGVRRRVNLIPARYEDQDPQHLRRGGWDPTGMDNEGFDLIIFDNYAPRQPPPVSSLSLGQVPPIDGLRLVPADDSDTAAQVILDWQRDHPLMRYVALDDVIMARPGRLVIPPQGAVLATGLSGPVMAAVYDDGLHHVVTSFPVLRSNWPLYVSFPVFVSNAVQWLGLGGQVDAGLRMHVGEVAVIPTVARGGTLTYDGPTTLQAAIHDGRAVLPMLDRVGLYRLRRGDAAGVIPPWDRLAVNLLNETESDLRPADHLQVGTTTIQGQTRTESIRREVWRWFIWAALAILMLEWLVYTRRMHV